MENDEKTLEAEEVQQDGEQVEVEETNPVGSTDEKEGSRKEEGVSLSPAEFRHYKKWKDSLKSPTPDVKKEQPQQVSQPNVEEVVLLAQGMSDELLNELKAVARARNITSLIKAQNDPIFVAVKEKFEKEKKQKDSSLPSSRGAGAVKAKKTFNSPGLTAEEHRQMFQDALK
jgi:hypothetical protein